LDRAAGARKRRIGVERDRAGVGLVAAGETIVEGGDAGAAAERHAERRRAADGEAAERLAAADVAVELGVTRDRERFLAGIVAVDGGLEVDESAGAGERVRL